LRNYHIVLSDNSFWDRFLLMTLGALLALCKSFSMQKSTVLCAIAAKRVKKQQTEKKIKKILVQKIGIPIMRLR
ncbi:hypothetical protein ACMWQA_26300, partial [Escherichia coli]|uniref:hypothetical protein n=1 Tax=Escherichia coli TaxID=562 RepID=UPI0039E0C4B9